MPAKRKRQTKLDTTAKHLGRTLGQTMAKIDRLKQQRAELARELHDVIPAAQDMLADLGDSAVIRRRQVRRGARRLKRQGRKVSKQARAKMAAAAKARWAKYRKSKKKAK